MQHNCFDGKCEAQSSTQLKHKRQEGNSIICHMVHTTDYSFLLDAFAHHEPSIDCELSNLNLEDITDQSTIEASHTWAKQKWDQHAPPAQPKNKGKAKNQQMMHQPHQARFNHNIIYQIFPPTLTSYNQMRFRAPQNNMHFPT
ncbi:hypothetical protein MJO28_005277 [Puccinia striiformis f. sp. tritici]|uniref:Uncharacterized protein n=1 Tax=Puccinia striiformis f. sp. tritici TaxID=168172 RepID=A0ACC0ELX0_9BASI|nr:hypothetical protein MJO28_005277 [Puccinia striiformis f. sp. tritici]